MQAPSKEAMILSYRQLYRQALRAIQYSSPARQIVQKRIQHMYRTGVATDYNEHKIRNTIEFLHGAAKTKGLEHHILKRLVYVWFWEAMNSKHVTQYFLRES